MAPFLCNFCVAASQSWGSNPDRSPVAQWSNMRISPASLPPGVHSKPVPGPALAESPVRRGRFSEITILAEILLHSKSLAGPLLGEAPCGGEGFQKSQYWPEFPSIQNPCLARRWRQAPCGGEGFQKSQYWPKLCLSPVIKVRDTREGSQAKYERNVKGSRGNQLLNLGWRQGGGRV